jgi:hypothetical protein
MMLYSQFRVLSFFLLFAVTVSAFWGCPKQGCTDQLAANYNPDAKKDDGSCFYEGCTDPSADNYDPNATVDDGSCIKLPFGYRMQIDYSNPSGNAPNVAIHRIDQGILTPSSNLFTMLTGDNKVELAFDELQLFEEGNIVLDTLIVNELRNDKWVSDDAFTASQEELTSAAIVLLLQKSTSEFDGHRNVIEFSQHLLDSLLTYPNVDFHLAVVEYGDMATVLKDFDTATPLNADDVAVRSPISNMEHAPSEASYLSEGLQTAADLLSGLPFEVYSKSIIVIGNGRDNVVNNVNNAEDYLDTKGINNVHCVGVEWDGATVPSDGATNLQQLANGRGSFTRADNKLDVNRTFRNYYASIPNFYRVVYTRTGVATVETIRVQFNFTCRRKMAN